MRVRRPWLWVALPALGSLLAAFGTVLWKVGENVDDLRVPARIGGAVGVVLAALFTLRPSPDDGE